MIGSQIVGSIYNISYNLIHLRPLLSDAQHAQFEKGVMIYNLIAYPLLISLWAWIVFSLRKADDRYNKRVIYLPRWATLFGAIGWLGSLVVLYFTFKTDADSITPTIIFHLSTSILTAMGIALSLTYMTVDQLRVRYVLPYFFSSDSSPDKINPGNSLSVMGRGVLWGISSCFCPIIALLLLQLSPARDESNIGFAIAVACSGIFFGIIGMILLRSLIFTPIEELREAADSIRDGKLDVKLNNLRIDEFGTLADTFNAMTKGLKEKEKIRTTLGMHVGEEIASELLKNTTELEGVERTITVLFTDIRSFTSRCEEIPAQQAVQLLNLYHTAITKAIQDHHGIVNQLIGDGNMSLFGATGMIPHAADNAVAAGLQILQEIDTLNLKLEELEIDPIRIGIGIHSGPAVIGTIGSPGRMVYTAIGDTVNTASRIESLTKELNTPLLLSEATAELLTHPTKLHKLPLQSIRGREMPIQLFSTQAYN